MTLVALASVKGAPGVTTLALALSCVWPARRAVTLVEADADGGVLAARRALAPEPGLVTLAAALRRGGGTLDGHTQDIGTGATAVVGPPAAEQTRAALLTAGDRLVTALTEHRGDVLVDCGRLTTTAPAISIAQRATTTLLVLRPWADEVIGARHRVASLRRAGVDPQLVLVRDGPYGAREVAAAVDASVLAEIAHDPRAAAGLAARAGGRVGSRSALLRSARQVAATIAPQAAAS